MGFGRWIPRILSGSRPRRSVWKRSLNQWADVAAQWQASPAKNISYRSTGVFSLETVGESHYQSSLRRARKLGEQYRNGVVVPVLVQRQPDNPYDPEAVVVTLPDGATISYLDRGWARRYQHVLRDAESDGLIFACWAYLAGGTFWKPSVGAWLDLEWPWRIEGIRSSQNERT